jgi:hypothetical protein
MDPWAISWYVISSLREQSLEEKIWEEDDLDWLLKKLWTVSRPLQTLAD